MNTTPGRSSLPVIDRELSWLSFNARVLAQGEDKQVPLLERLRFLSIFSRNLDEFFMVRLPIVLDRASRSAFRHRQGTKPAGDWNQSVDTTSNRIKFMAAGEQPGPGRIVIDDRSHSDDRGKIALPAGVSRQNLDSSYSFVLLRQIFDRAAQLCRRLEESLAGLEEEMATRGITRLHLEQLTPRQRQAVRRYFDEALAPVLIPMRVGPRAPLPEAPGKSLYIGLLARRGSRIETILLPCPTAQGVFLLPGGTQYLPEEEIIEAYCHTLPAFRETQIVGRGSLTITRGARAPVDEEQPDYASAVDEMLRQRSHTPITRIEVGRRAPEALIRTVCRTAAYPPDRVIRRQGPLSLSYIRPLLGALARSGPAADCRVCRHGLSIFRRRPNESSTLWRYPPFQPGISLKGDIAEAVRRRDRLLCYPYQSAEPFLRLLEQAARDPAVRAIRMTVYRMGEHPRIPETLICAARRGKSVTVILELQARFDEKNNLLLAARLIEAGCTVLYGMEGVKVHAKLGQIVYDRGQGTEMITLLGTGNLNPVTARQYTDYWLMTADQKLGEEAAEWFRRVALGGPVGTFDRLLTSPDALDSAIRGQIDQQIERAERGLPSGIFFKVNSLSDRGIIRCLYTASRAGVPVRLLVRGICCLIPQTAGLSDTIEVRSIVGRFLEHSRVYCFGAGANSQVFLSSADLMPRNLHRRAELAFPVEDPVLRHNLLRQMELVWRDNVKARRLCGDGIYRPVSDHAPSLDAQFELLRHFAESAEP